MQVDSNNDKDLVNELIESQKPPVEEPKEKREPRRNSKDDIIDKIMQLSQEIGEPVPETNTQLKRMSKRQLADKLAGLIEKRVEFEASKVLGINKEQAGNPYVVNMAALRMCHDIVCSSTEALVERTSHKHGMTLKGFTQRMRDSKESVDMCLHEICQQYPDILEKVSSPWLRLGLLWGSNVMVTLKKKKVITNAPNVQPKSDQRVRTI